MAAQKQEQLRKSDSILSELEQIKLDLHKKVDGKDMERQVSSFGQRLDESERKKFDIYSVKSELANELSDVKRQIADVRK